MSERSVRIETRVVDAAPASPTDRRPVVTPIVQSVNFSAPDVRTWSDTAGGDSEYTRFGNPTLTAVEGVIADLECGAGALVFGSGMAAISSALMALLTNGDHVVAHQQLFYGTYRFMCDWLPRAGIQVSLVDLRDHDALLAALRPTTRVIYLESPTNPLLDVLDLTQLARVGRDRGLTTVVDNTFATPFNQRPLELGADIVVHSATKYLAGHSDVVCGALSSRSESLLTRVLSARTNFGGILDPHAAFLLQRGIKTLGVRMPRHNDNGLAVAQFLASHRAVDHVYYPFLDSHPQAKLSRAQMAGGSGIASFVPKGGVAAAVRFLDRVRLARRAGSLGSVESLVIAPGLLHGHGLSAEARQSLGLREDLIRVSVGIEHIEDVIADFDWALA